jgi:hypothetical protein
MPAYSVSCRGDLPRGAIAQLEEAGLYQAAERELGFTESDRIRRHFLIVEAGSPEDAILIARGALAVAGATASDFQVGHDPADAD